MDIQSAAFCIKKRFLALNDILVNAEKDCVAVLGCRLKLVILYQICLPDAMVKALAANNMCKNSYGDRININSNKRNVILKQNDGLIYLGDPYLCHTSENYLKSKPSGSLNRVIYLHYDVATNRFTEVLRTGDNAAGNTNITNSINKTELVGIETHKRSLASTRKNCKLSGPNVYSVIDIRYNSPLISSRSGDNQNVADCSGFNLSNQRLPYTTRHPHFCRYLTRLATFSSWRRHLDPRCLAENGFFYQGIGDTIICYSCGVALMHWNPDDDVLLEHLRYSPNCKHLEDQLGRTTIVEYLGQTNHCVDKGVFDVDKHISKTSPSSADLYSENFRLPRSPEYQSMSVRVFTFARFPNHKGINICDLAGAGFYYTGVDDLVRCYCCDLEVKQWEYGDDPYWEHAILLAECVHLRRVKGKEFVAHVQGTEKQKLHRYMDFVHAPTLKYYGRYCGLNLAFVEDIYALLDTWATCQKTNPIERKNECASGEKLKCSDVKHEDAQAAAANSDQWPDKETWTTDILNTPAAQSVLQFGYSKELVIAAVAKLKGNGHSSLTAMQILEVILDAEDRKIDLCQKFVRIDLQNGPLANGFNDDESRQLHAENQRMKSLMRCKQCQLMERNMLFLPCSHRNLCDACAEEVNVCPECQQQIKGKVKTYMS